MDKKIYPGVLTFAIIFLFFSSGISLHAMMRFTGRLMLCCFRTCCYDYREDENDYDYDRVPFGLTRSVNDATPLFAALTDQSNVICYPCGRCSFFNCLYYATCCCGCLGPCILLVTKNKMRRRRINQAIDLTLAQPGLQVMVDGLDGETKVCDVIPAINQPDHMGWTALHYACLSGSYRAIQKLVREGVDVNALSNFGFSSDGPAQWSHAKKVTHEQVHDEPEKYYRASPLHCALLHGKIDTHWRDAVSTLIACGADPDHPGCIISPRNFIHIHHNGLARRSSSHMGNIKEIIDAWEKAFDDGLEGAQSRFEAIRIILHEHFRHENNDVIVAIILPYVQWFPGQQHAMPHGGFESLIEATSVDDGGDGGSSESVALAVDLQALDLDAKEEEV